MSELISWLFSFKALNFIFVIGVFIYLIKTRLIPVLSKAVSDKDAALKEIKGSAKEAQDRQKEVARNIEEQKLYGQELLDKMKQWNTIVDEDNTQQEKVEKDAKKRLKAYVSKQQHALLLEHLKKEMIPCVMKEATESLEKYFTKKSEQEKFLNKSLEAMEKEQA